MYYRRPKRKPRRYRQRPEDRPEDVVPIVEDKGGALLTMTLSNPRTRTDCVIAIFPGDRPGNLRVMLNGSHEPKLATNTKLTAWLRRKLPRTSPKRATE